jgi:subtilisin family serine protease
MNTYIVALNEGVDYDAFWNEIENISPDDGFVPSRRVDIVNSRDAFKRICEYALTEEEAEQLKNDPRIAAVERPVRDLPFVKIVNNALDKNFDKTTLSTGDNVNWGLIRHSNITNIYGNSIDDINNNYIYNLDGTGVDIVINDSGLQIDHPEFSSRVLNVGWDSYTPGGITGLNQINQISRQDTDGHGTHVAGIAGGTTYGWAKGANIVPLYYALNDYDNNGEPLDIFEALINWHNSKTVNPITGVKNPTVVNMSWKLTATVNTTLLIGGKYRTDPVWSAVGKTTTFFNNIGLTAGTGPVQNEEGQISPGTIPYSSLVYNTAMAELINSGIIVVQAAGNDGYKIDIEGGADYKNYIISSLYPGKFYYHRGTSPSDPRVIIVGNLDYYTEANGLERRSSTSTSNAGPRIDVWAAGTWIMSACSNTNNWNGRPYQHGNSNYKQVNMSGTSMAAPQITGMCALYLQKNPTATPAEVKAWIKNTSIKDKMYSTGLNNDYTNSRSLLGGTAGIAYQNLLGLTKSYIKDDTNTWQEAKEVYVKLDNGTWKQAKEGWKKNETGEWEKIYEL